MVAKQERMKYPMIDILHPYYYYDIDSCSWKLFYDLKIPRKERLLKCLCLMFVDSETIKQTLLPSEIENVNRYLMERNFIFVHQHESFMKYCKDVQSIVKHRIYHIRNIESFVEDDIKFYGTITNRLIDTYLKFFARKFCKLVSRNNRKKLLELKLQYDIGNDVYFVNLDETIFMHNILISHNPATWQMLKKQYPNAIVCFDWKKWKETNDVQL